MSRKANVRRGTLPKPSSALYGSNGAIYVGSPAAGSGGSITGTYFASGSWAIGGFFDVQPEPSTTPTTPGGVLERIVWELGGIHGEAVTPDRVKGVLLHALTWHMIKQYPTDNVSPEGYIAGVPIRTTWEIPEYEWVFAYNPPVVINTQAKAKAHYEESLKDLFKMFDAKSLSIQAKKR